MCYVLVIMCQADTYFAYSCAAIAETVAGKRLDNFSGHSGNQHLLKAVELYESVVG